jgi:hypothetical protein
VVAAEGEEVTPPEAVREVAAAAAADLRALYADMGPGGILVVTRITTIDGVADHSLAEVLEATVDPSKARLGRSVLEARTIRIVVGAGTTAVERLGPMGRRIRVSTRVRRMKIDGRSQISRSSGWRYGNCLGLGVFCRRRL